MSNIITFSIDPDAFQKEVIAVFKGSPLADNFKNGKLVLSGLDFMGLVEVARNACASVEVVKMNLLNTAYPDGVPSNVKFTPDVCLRVAVDLIFMFVKFGGTFGWIIGSFGRPLVIAIIEAVLTGLKGKDWLYTAKKQLKMVA